MICLIIINDDPCGAGNCSICSELHFARRRAGKLLSDGAESRARARSGFHAVSWLRMCLRVLSTITLIAPSHEHTAASAETTLLTHIFRRCYYSNFYFSTKKSTPESADGAQSIEVIDSCGIIFLTYMCVCEGFKMFICKNGEILLKRGCFLIGKTLLAKSTDLHTPDTV